MSSTSAYWKAVAVGVIAGMRSMSAPFLVSQHLGDGRETYQESFLSRLLVSPLVSRVLLLAAAGEMAADKLPFIPARVEPPALLGRIVMGGLSGAALLGAHNNRATTGFLMGAIGALAGSFAFYLLRREIVEGTTLSDSVVALAEDTLALTGGLAVLQN